MGILDRIAADNDAALAEEHEQLLLTTARTDYIKALRAAIIDGHVQSFGASIGESVESANRSGGRYYIIGGVVIAVRLFEYVPIEDRGKTEPNEVVWQHNAAVVGVDLTGRLLEVGRGSLKLFSYDNIRRAVNDHPGLEYDSSFVLKLLD